MCKPQKLPCSGRVLAAVLACLETYPQEREDLAAAASEYLGELVSVREVSGALSFFQQGGMRLGHGWSKPIGRSPDAIATRERLAQIIAEYLPETLRPRPSTRR